MIKQAPTFDDRSSKEIAQQLLRLVRVYSPQWKEFDPVTQEATGVSAALIGIVARFAEVIIQRLNQAPQKNFLAFLDMLGASRLPPQPARAPLTFFLAAGSAGDGLVQAGTQVAAPPAQHEKDPVIFETERELVVTAAQLSSLFVRDPEQDRQADRSSGITSAAAVSNLLFQGDQPIDHILYIGDSRLFGFSHIVNARLAFTLDSNGRDARQVVWETWDGTQWREKVPTSDQNVNTLLISGGITLGSLAPVPESRVNNIQSRWLRARLLTPITIANTARQNMVRATDLPKVRLVQLSVDVARDSGEGLIPDAAFTNAVPIELGKDFFPFGERPRLNDAFYIASTEAFSKDRAAGLAARGASVDLDLEIPNSHLTPSASSVWPSRDLQLAWECWNGKAWQRVGTSRAPDWLSVLEVERPPEVVNEASLIIQGKAQRGTTLVFQTLQGAAGFTLPVPVRIGDDGRFAVTLTTVQGLNLITFGAIFKGQLFRGWATFFRGESGPTQRPITVNVDTPSAPVDAATVNLTVEVDGTNAAQVTLVRISNGHTNPPVQGPKGTPLSVPLFEGRNDLLIEGLSATGAPLAAKTVSIGRRANPPAPEPTTGFIDGTHAFCQGGTISFTVPDQVAAIPLGGQENFWVRARIIRGDYGNEPNYKLKSPAAPEEGFILVLDTFRPPAISSVKIGYQQTLSGAPEAVLAYNNSAFSAPARPGVIFEPFRRTPEHRPTFYAGFTLPADRNFPNRPITFYIHLEALRFGEIAKPISPARSKQVGLPEVPVRHSFIITNSGPTSNFSFKVFGTTWQPPPLAPASISIPSEESRQVEIEVTAPAGTPPGRSDLGYLQLASSIDPSTQNTAAFVTFAVTETPTGEQLRLVWEYWNGKQWSALTVRDDTENFTRPGLVEFLPPPDFSSSNEFGLSPRYWLRVRWESGEYPAAPRLRRLLLNTTMAAQTVTIRNEPLGSSIGVAGQKFRSTKAPILIGQGLEVREPEMPSAAEMEIITREEGEDAVTTVLPAPGRPREIWVRWHEVTDFYASGPRDRHYVLDHLSGEIRTGDGLNGLIPPVGTGNVRLARYQIGGGSTGNKPAGAIVQLKTTVPYVDKVINSEDAAGGADAETLDSLLVRAPRTIRHRDRAVTLEDYEDVAMLASPAVARAKCIPLRNLIDDPLDERPKIRGEVSVIVVPRSDEAKPVPSLELISRVQDYLEAHSVPTSRVSVVGPLYVRVNVNVEIALASLEGASLVEQATQESLAAFLHPLTGGAQGTGWDFGRSVHQSDLYALIESVPGVDHIRSLEIQELEDKIGVKATNRFLVFSGTHKVNLFFET